jgi:hypothetical protein
MRQKKIDCRDSATLSSATDAVWSHRLEPHWPVDFSDSNSDDSHWRTVWRSLPGRSFQVGTLLTGPSYIDGHKSEQQAARISDHLADQSQKLRLFSFLVLVRILGKGFGEQLITESRTKFLDLIFCRLATPVYDV